MKQAKEIKVQLTGWPPYADYPVNPSREVAMALHQSKIGRATVNSLILPISFRRAFDILRKEIDTHRPDAIISLGIIPFTFAIQVEKVAVNILDTEGYPDEDGLAPQDEPIIKGAPTAYFSTLPIRKIAENLRKSGIPAVISYSAGAHACNWIMYNVLHYLSQREWNVPAGFIHLPFLPQQVPPIIPSSVVQQCTPSLPLEVMIKGLQIAIQTISETLL